jgi:hypothetical protein
MELAILLLVLAAPRRWERERAEVLEAGLERQGRALRPAFERDAALRGAVDYNEITPPMIVVPSTVAW